MTRRPAGQRAPQAIPGDRADLAGFPRLVEEFCEDMAARGYSPRTIGNRRAMLAFLAAWLAERGITRPAEVTRPVLESYQRHLFHYRKTNGDPLSFRSQSQRLLAVRAFYKWAARQRHVLHNPASEIELPRAERRLPRPALTAAEAELVLAQPDVADPLGVRDRAILEVFYSTGIRRSELASLAVTDIDRERQTLLVPQGKGKQDRMIPIGERALAWAARYLAKVRPKLAIGDDDGSLFLTADGEPFSLDRLTQLASRHVKASGVPKAGACHLFRHTMATLMLEGGADIRYIQATLGSTPPRSTPRSPSAPCRPSTPPPTPPPRTPRMVSVTPIVMMTPGGWPPPNCSPPWTRKAGRKNPPGHRERPRDPGGAGRAGRRGGPGAQPRHPPRRRRAGIPRRRL